MANYYEQARAECSDWFSRLSFWQFSETDNVSGIVGNKVGQDIFKERMEELRGLAGY